MEKAKAMELLLEMQDNCVRRKDHKYYDPKRFEKAEALEMAMDALGKNNTVKINESKAEMVIPIKKINDDLHGYDCPICNANICGPYIQKSSIEDVGREFEFNYCHKCGTRLDWRMLR